MKPLEGFAHFLLHQFHPDHKRRKTQVASCNSWDKKAIKHINQYRRSASCTPTRTPGTCSSPTAARTYVNIDINNNAY